MEITDGAVQNALDAEDVEGLLKIGAPSDEYAAEARMIARQLGGVDAPSEDAVTAIVANVCVRMFGPFSDDQLERRMTVYRNVARRIIQHLQVKHASQTRCS